MRTFEQDPLDKRMIVVDYSGWLGAATIASAAWVVPTELTASDDSFTTTTVTNYFAGGTLDTEYEVAVTITTGETVTRDKTQRFIIKIEKNFD
jgi:hypothetical protein